jgi:tetratricopeptide (TPR) repeat protein
MKKQLFLLFGLLLTASAFSQTQQGFVKTKGRMVNGKLVPGQGLKGATVSVQGRTTVLVNADDGAFSFPTPDNQFKLDSVKKIGYQLVDMDACPRTYNYSKNPLYIVMETPEQQLQDKLNAERKIRRNLQKQLQEREDEIEDLKAQQKISDEEYRQALQKLYADQESNEQLISDMAKRYSELDYDQLDEFYRQVSFFIENGELVKADSLLNTRGDLSKQVEEQLQKGQAIQEQQEQLDKAKVVHAADQDELARRCYSYYETFAAQHLNDTAAYYLELRASLDTTNVDWQNDAGEYFKVYIANYKKALELHQRALRQVIRLGDNHQDETSSYCFIGSVYFELGEYQKALDSYNKALLIIEETHENEALDIARIYSHLGSVYFVFDEYDKSLDYLNKALEIQKKELGPEHLDVSYSYNNIGVVYSNSGEHEKALENLYKSLEIRKQILGFEHPSVATTYNNIGLDLLSLGEYDKALDCLTNSLNIREKTLGLMHPNVAQAICNIGGVYSELGEHEKALYYFKKALEIQAKALGSEHPVLALFYNNIGATYYDLNDCENALTYYNTALEIRIKAFGSEHILVAKSYFSIGRVYLKASDFTKALEYFQKALEIQVLALGEDHPETIQTKEKIEKVQAKIAESER